MNQPLVSILVPIYNVENYIRECIYSIKNQTYTNFEVICINDGCTDQTEKIYYEAVGDDPRFTLYVEKNGGLSHVRNVSLKLAKGELITYVDSDDTIEPEYVETLVKGIVEHDCDISICGHNMKYPKATFPFRFPKDTIFSQKKALRYLMADFLIMNYSWGKCYKRELWKGIEYPETRIYEDVETICKTFLRAKKLYISNKLLYNYAIRPGSISQQKAKGRNRELKRAYVNQMQTVSQHYPSYRLFSYFNCLKADVMFYYDVITCKIEEKLRK